MQVPGIKSLPGQVEEKIVGFIPKLLNMFKMLFIASPSTRKSWLKSAASIIHVYPI